MTPSAVVALDAESDAERAEKRPGAFRTISEVAEDLALPQHVLRFWETRFSQVRPLKRAGGRRYYRPDDVDLLRGIRRLLQEQGYTIRGAQRVLRDKGVRFVQAVGRGEAEAGAPAVGECEAARSASGTDTGESKTVAAARDDVLQAVLRELRACRDTLARLRSEAPEEP